MNEYMEPALYPLYGIIYVLLRPDLLIRVLGLLVLELLVPVYWVSDWLVDRHHARIFNLVLAQELGASKPTDALDAAAREALLQRASSEKVKRANRDLPSLATLTSATSKLHPALRAVIWVFTPPSSDLPFLQFYAKKLVNAPVKLLLPGGRYIFGVRDSAAMGLITMSPYLKAKGLDRRELKEAVGLIHRWRLRRFGMTVYVLSAIPVLSWLFAFTNYVGAALWAADFERGRFRLIPA